jgi:hypothetical protein
MRRPFTSNEQSQVGHGARGERVSESGLGFAEVCFLAGRRWCDQGLDADRKCVGLREAGEGCDTGLPPSGLLHATCMESVDA